MLADLDLNPIDGLTHAFVWVINGLDTLFRGVPLLAQIGAFGLAIVTLTLVLRTFLFPLFAWQIRASRTSQMAMAKIQPQITELRAKYRGQPQKLQQEQTKLFRENGIHNSAMQGCIPTLLQLPIILALYGAIRATNTGSRSDLGFLWVHNVTQTAREACCLITQVGNHQYYTGPLSGFLSHPATLILPFLAGLMTYVQARMMLMPAADGATAQQQTMANMGSQMTLLMPVMIFVFALGFAQGVALYWVTQSTYMVVQQYYLVGWGGLHMPHWVPGARRVTDLTHEVHRRHRQGSTTVAFAPSTRSDGAGVIAGDGGNGGRRTEPETIAPPTGGAQTQTKAMAAPVGSPSRMDKGSGGGRKRRR